MSIGDLGIRLLSNSVEVDGPAGALAAQLPLEQAARQTDCLVECHNSSRRAAARRRLRQRKEFRPCRNM